MIHIFVGTKAQFIKMAPIMHELDRRGIIYNFIDAGQHAGLTSDLVDQFELRTPDVYLRESNKNIVSLTEAISWITESTWDLISKKNEIYEGIFNGKGGVCLIHGDTLTTLLSLMHAKRCGLKVAHVEAGLRSHHFFDPFPEEIIRVITMKYSDLLFAPSTWAYENICKMGYKNKSINIEYNTGLDSVRFAMQMMNGRYRPTEPYVVFTTHRFETIFSRKRMTKIVSLAERIAKDYKVLFVLHEPTYRQLLRYKLYDVVKKNKRIETLSLQAYPVFIDLLAGAEYIVTDGGSIQEESYFINIPCLVMRENTERMEGLGENIYLAGFDENSIEKFFDQIPSLRRKETEIKKSPSSCIVDYILSNDVIK